MTYATWEDWDILDPDTCPEDGTVAEQWLHRASRDIDTLTFNRIRAAGFDRLSEFQREIVTEVTCRLAGWQAANADLLESPLSGYSINGVSAQFGKTAGVTVQDGVILPRQLYRLLEQTGLCCRRL